MWTIPGTVNMSQRCQDWKSRGSLDHLVLVRAYPGRGKLNAAVPINPMNSRLCIKTPAANVRQCNSPTSLLVELNIFGAPMSARGQTEKSGRATGEVGSATDIVSQA